MRGFKHTLGWGVLILGAAAVPALATAWWHPTSPYAAAKASAGGSDAVSEGLVSLAEVKGWTERVLWIDARPDEVYDRGHIPGAISLNESTWDDKLFVVFDRYQPGDRLVVYCGGRTCGLSREVAQRLRDESGIDAVYVLEGGWDAWQAAQ